MRRQKTGIGTGPVSLRRLRVAGVVLPVLFVVALELIRFLVIENDFADYSPHIVLAALTVVAIIGFSFVMFHFVARAQAETSQVVTNLQRRQREGHAFYDVLLRISNQDPLADILAAVARHSRDLLASDHAAVCLNHATTRSVQLDSTPAGAASPRDGVCIVPDAEEAYDLHDLGYARSLRSSAELRENLQVQVHSSGRAFGEVWIGRTSAVPFERRDREFLTTFSDIASIAVAGARMRESERQGAILAERERIARELHDSLAQVLGAVHLRLRTLASREDAVTLAIALELIELADVCEEGYGDARGAILDLHESSRVDRNLLDSLRAYLDKYSRQCGIATSLEASLEHDLALPPRSEIQIIRVVQEALTNVRKHSGAAAATVRVAEDNGTVTFVVEDDGRGFDATKELSDRGGFGLHSMRERMEMIGGTLLADSASGRGTRIVAELPNVPARAPIPSI
ncbi:MAG TPA: GAF domain-containing sensor histidine kinase [Solirubrobacteraceae bacterium]|nr:GAF domain-containing sensor histidine kinase [Solirubrobacteraceae bacterium]